MTTPLHDFRVSRSASSSPARTAGRSSPTSGPTSSRWSSPVGRLDASVGCVWEGRSLSWSVIARGKRCVTGDLHYDGGRALSLDLVREAGIVVKNFRPGTMERLGLGYADLSAVNPGIVMVRSAGSVQDGPLPRAPATVRSARRWAACATRRRPNRPPSRFGVSLGDEFAGLHAALGTLLALRAREHRPRAGRRRVDLPVGAGDERGPRRRLRRRRGHPRRHPCPLPGVAPGKCLPHRRRRPAGHRREPGLGFRRLPAAIG